MHHGATFIYFIFCGQPFAGWAFIVYVSDASSNSSPSCLVTFTARLLYAMADITKTPPLSRPSVIAAHKLIKKHIHFTPVLTNTTLTSLASTPQTPDALRGTAWEGQPPAKPTIRLWFKCENLQKVGAFKVRGAFHALTRLMAQEGWEEQGGRERGVVTHSSGSPLCLSRKQWG
jgi:hypothetical protein